MPTIKVGPSVKFKNFFTRFGREKNNLYKQMNDAGFLHITQRNLKNGSSVVLGYKNLDSRTNDIAFMLNPNLTMEQKEVVHSYAMLPWDEQIIHINKVFANKKGEPIKYTSLNTKMVNGSTVSRRKIDMPIDKITTAKSYAKYGGAEPYLNKDIKIATSDIVRTTEKSNDEFKYSILEHLDGKKTYIKDVNGQIYTFTSK